MPLPGPARKPENPAASAPAVCLPGGRREARLHRLSAAHVRRPARPPLPVLFMQDGQNLFDPETCFTHGNYWHMGETADALIAAGEIEPLIIVGIYNTGEHRIDEYTPVEDKRLGGGQADAYGQMLVEELKPFVDHTYRTLPGTAHCGLGGSSLGGLVTLYLGLRYTWMFSKLAVMSPSVWWRNRAILKTVAQDPAQTRAEDLARHRDEREPARAARCARAEPRVGEEGLGRGPRSFLPRGRRRRTHRSRLGRSALRRC